MRFPDFQDDREIPYETLYAPPAFTAQRRAQYLHVPGKQVAKAVLLSGPMGHFVAVLPATHQIDTDRLAEHLGGDVWIASEKEIADVFMDCEWGVVPPFGARYGLTTLLDDSIASEDWIVFETSQRGIAVRMRCANFEQVEKPQRLAFALASYPSKRR